MQSQIFSPQYQQCKAKKCNKSIVDRKFCMQDKYRIIAGLRFVKRSRRKVKNDFEIWRHSRYPEVAKKAIA